MRPVSGPPAKIKEEIPDYDESGERELTEQEKIDRCELFLFFLT